MRRSGCRLMSWPIADFKRASSLRRRCTLRCWGVLRRHSFKRTLGRITSGFWINHLYRPLPCALGQFLNLAVAILLGLVGAIGLAFLVERLDNTVKSQLDLENYGLTFLGIVPSARSVRGRGGMPRVIGDPDRCVIDHPNSTLAECVRIIRTNLLFTWHPRMSCGA